VGETKNQSFHFSFCSSLRVDFQGSQVTSAAGLLLVRELDERLGLGQLIRENLTDARRGKNTQLPLPDLLRQSVYSRLAGYEDLNDAERLAQDPTFRLLGSEKIWERGAALPSRLHWFETGVLMQAANLRGLEAINRELIARVEGQEWSWRAVLDMDSTEIPVYGQQEHSAENAGAILGHTTRQVDVSPLRGFVIWSHLYRGLTPAAQTNIARWAPMPAPPTPALVHVSRTRGGTLVSFRGRTRLRLRLPRHASHEENAAMAPSDPKKKVPVCTGNSGSFD
jgi:hypothetical protein